MHNVMEVAASAMRGCIIAPPGKKLVVADLSNIEGRVQAWLAGESWKLQAFRDYDTILGHDEKGKAIRKGFDLYCLAYANSFGINPGMVTKDQRQKGKVQELALGYQGGVGAFVTFAIAYNIDLDQMAADAWPDLPIELVVEAEKFLSWLHSKVWDASEKRIKKGADLQTEANRVKEELDAAQYGLSREVFIVCDVFKRAWRLAHPRIVALWKELGDAVVMATNRPGVTYVLADGKLKIRRDGAWLRIQLPSGGFLCYPSPQVDKDGGWSYMGVNQYNRKYCRIKSYGGKTFEQCTQGIARDVLAYNMPDIEAAGYEMVLTVHDEALTETPDEDRFSVRGLCKLLAANKKWSAGLPLAAEGFEGPRYHK
jgi:DNA polymerase